MNWIDCNLRKPEAEPNRWLLARLGPGGFGTFSSKFLSAVKPLELEAVGGITHWAEIEPPGESGHCAWNETKDGCWETNCDEMFVFEESGPLENKMKFCCYCGRPLIEIRYRDSDDLEEAQ